MEPTIICRPLANGGNFVESYAPLIFVQEYSTDRDLAKYFESPKYSENAMYVTLFGDSDYVAQLAERPIEGRVLHTTESILRDTHLHAPGVERGTKPYGGLGFGASSVSIGGNVIPMATLPQRDIYNFVALPVLEDKGRISKEEQPEDYSELELKNVEKLLRLRPERAVSQSEVRRRGRIFIDLTTIGQGRRYLAVDGGTSFELLSEANMEYIAGMSSEDVMQVQSLWNLILEKDRHTLDSFSSAIYSIAKNPDLSRKENSPRQLRFFRLVYQVLFGADSGPNLGSFLWEADVKSFESLIAFFGQDA